MHHRRLVALACAALAGVLGAPAHAEEDWNNSFRLGSYSIFYHTHADDLAGPYVPPDVGLKAVDLETLYVGYVRRVYAGFEIELALGYPPLSKVDGRGAASLGSVPYAGQTISSARWLSPTVLFEYRFLDDRYRLRPYVGVGVNYTAFYDRDSTAAGNAASGGPTKLSLTSSVGPAATVGFSYHVVGRFNLYASYSVSRVKTTIEADTAGTIRTTQISFGPQALVVSGGISF